MELLASKLRPQKKEDIIGQTHLFGPDKVLSNLLNNKVIFSMILYGEPGSGKTSIANVIVNELNKEYRILNATSSKKNDFDIVIEEAKMLGEIILIIDEIHRMNKDKQDILLPYIESGLIIIVGLTTMNPYYSINPSIRSRCQIFEIKPLNNQEIKEGIIKGIKYLNASITDEAIDILIYNSAGDLRNALNLLEVAYYVSNKKEITKQLLNSINSRPIIYHDKNDSNHYDIISAFQKSIRGSDINASIYYLSLLIEAGDLDIILRRLAVIAYEDIGLANPSIGPKIMAVIEAVKLLGLPEGRIPLATIVSEMALSPKSNSAYLAIDNALNEIRKGNTGKVPDHLKSNSKNYQYPHMYSKSYVEQQYLPDNIKDIKFYYPKKNNYENNLNKIYDEMMN